MIKKIVLFVFTFQLLMGYELGTIATASKSEMYYKLGNDISSLLKKYDIDLKPITTGGSYENINILNGSYIENQNTFFAIVQKDAINYYNFIEYTNSGNSIFHKFPAVLSLGIEQIHIMALEGSEYDFDRRKVFKVYCGDSDGGSCITAKYIEKAYGFEFVYVNSKPDTVMDKLKNGMVDWVISVIEAPAQKFQNLEGIKFIDLPTNFIMEDMYTHSELKKSDYPFLNEDMHTFAVPKVLITNLSDVKYAPVIENIVKIIVLNKKLLVEEYGAYWNNIDFFYYNFKRMSPYAQKTLEAIEKSN